MDGLIHPVGPEPEQTYWLRRAAVLGVLLAVLVGAGFMINSLGQGRAAAEPASGQQAPQAPQEQAPPEEQTTPEPQNPPEEAPAPSATPSSAGTPAPKPEPEAPAPTKPASQAPTRAAPTKAPQPAPASRGTFAATVGSAEPPGCDPAKLRVGMDGPRQVRAGVPVKFRIAIGNDTGQRCQLQVDEKTFELKVYSGTDRIWTSLHCLPGMAPKHPVLEPGKEFAWEQEWRANRSAPGCKAGTEPMGSGTYVATAQLKDARPVQVIMQLSA